MDGACKRQTDDQLQQRRGNSQTLAVVLCSVLLLITVRAHDQRHKTRAKSSWPNGVLTRLTPHALVPSQLQTAPNTQANSEPRTSASSAACTRSGLASSYAEWRSGEAHTSTLATQNPVTRRCAKRTPASTTGLKPTDCSRPGHRRPRSAVPISGDVDAPIGGVVTARHTTGPRTEPRESCPQRARVRSGDNPTSDENRRMV